MVGGLPANAGDAGSGPGPGGSTCRRAAATAEPALWNPHDTTAEARAPGARAPQQERPPQWGGLRTAVKSSPRSTQLGKARAQG